MRTARAWQDPKLMNTTDPLASASAALTADRLTLLQSEFVRCTPISGGWNRVANADNVRFCRWPGQNADGRKHDQPDKPAFPWDGASDTRPFTADQVINEQAALVTAAFWRAIVRPKVADDTVGQYATALADYFVHQVLVDDLETEVELSANHLLTYGWTLLHPTWEQRVALRKQKVGLADLVSAGARLAPEFPDRPGLQDLAGAVLDPFLEEQALADLAFVYDHFARTQMEGALEVEIPPLSEPVLRRAVRELREDGATSVPVPYVAASAPAVYALRPWDEVFVPEDTTRIQHARVIYRREWVTEADLIARINDDGYDPAWVAEAAKHQGKVTQFLADSSVALSVTENFSRSLTGNLIEVIHAFARGVDESKVPGVYCTTFHSLVNRRPGGQGVLAAKHELIDYPHGEYPFVEGKREKVSRRLTASRGVPEILATGQQEIKSLRDGIIDWTSLGVIPPVNQYKTPFDTKYRFGPAVINTVVPGKEPQFMAIPSSGVPAALTSLERMDFWTANYFGMPHPLVPPERVQTVQAKAVQGFLLMWSKALQQMVALAQGFMGDADFARVTGAPEGWLNANRHRMGVLAVELEFDVRELNEELTTRRIEAVNKSVLPGDVQGVIARNKWVEMQLRAINPRWAKELVMPASEASQSLFSGVKNDIALMFLGNAPQMVENDPTAQSKLQFAQQIVGANPNYQQALAAGGRFAELMKLYAKNLAFSVTQEKNKQIGRIGVSPEPTATAGASSGATAGASFA